jgi:DNA-binding LacI/PurR family transcriptional regulator
MSRQYRSFSNVTVTRRQLSVREIVTAAELMGLRIPEDLSVVVVGQVLMRKDDPTRRFCRLDYQRERMANLCFDLLEQQARTRRREMSRLLLNTAVCDGESLGPPRGMGSVGVVNVLESDGRNQ